MCACVRVCVRAHTCVYCVCVFVSVCVWICGSVDLVIWSGILGILISVTGTFMDCVDSFIYLGMCEDGGGLPHC